jgi:hypothetical protein
MRQFRYESAVYVLIMLLLKKGAKKGGDLPPTKQAEFPAKNSIVQPNLLENRRADKNTIRHRQTDPETARRTIAWSMAPATAVPSSGQRLFTQTLIS